MKQKQRKGVTLLELILVIAIIAILFAAIFVALDPARRLAESRNSRRVTDVTAIADALAKYRVDNGGDNYSTVAALTAGQFTMIGTATDDLACQDSAGTPYTSASALCAATSGTGATADDCVDLSSLGSNYISSLPVDPSAGTASLTDYYVSVGSTGQITVGACGAEGEGAGGGGTAPTIAITR